MRIKFNDKIYRLKEIESGVDSLMELVEESKHKHGDFLMNDNRLAFILDREGGDGEAYYLFCTDMDGEIQSHMQEREKGVRYCGYLKHAVLADSEATEAINDGLKSIGKRWNDDKKCVEDIPKRKFKNGDKVTLKSGCISKTDLEYLPFFDKYIGERLEVVSYTESGNVQCNNYFIFHEDWLEPCSDEPKKGDLAIFWDSDQAEARIGVYNQFYDGSPFPHEDHIGDGFKNAVKFESKKQFKRFIKGEL